MKQSGEGPATPEAGPDEGESFTPRANRRW